MKAILIILTLTIASLSFASPKPSFVCIGQEELRIHKAKIGGHYKKLNQKMISYLVQLGQSTEMNKDVLSVICSKSNTYPSVDLLYFLLTKKQNVFKNQVNKFSKQQRDMDQLAVNSFVNDAPEILAGFINDIQSGATRPNCLVNMIPELKNYFYKSRYILEDVGVKRMMKELKNIRGIFLKLKSKKLKKACF